MYRYFQIRNWTVTSRGRNTVISFLGNFDHPVFRKQPWQFRKQSWPSG